MPDSGANVSDISRAIRQRLNSKRDAGGGQATQRRATSGSREEHPADTGSTADRDEGVTDPKSMEELDAAGDRAEAAELLRSIYADFSHNRNDGRSQAWAELENKIADAAPQLILYKLISPKDLTGLLIDIEQFRKQETGTQLPAGDWLAQWLTEKVPEPIVVGAVVAKPSKRKVSDKIEV